jgi:hypothetical protein
MSTCCITPPRLAWRLRNPQPVRRAAYLGPAARGKDTHEIEDPSYFLLPDAAHDRPAHRSKYVIAVGQIRRLKAGALPRRGPGTTAVRTLEPGYEPGPEAGLTITHTPDVPAMLITICGATITSDQNPGTTRQASGGHGWEVPWLPDRTLDRNTATTAMTLAGTAGTADFQLGRPPWPAVEGQAVAPDLTGSDAIACESPPIPATARQPGTHSRRQDQEAAD